MPALASPATWRTHRQRFRLHAYILNPDVVVSRRVNTTTFTYPITILTYDNPDASGGNPVTDVNVGMTVRIKDGTTQAFKGWARITYTPSATDFFIAPISQGIISFANNDIIEVLDEYRPWARIPKTVPDGTLYMDWDNRFGSDNVHMKPKANAGPWYAGEVDSVTNLITVQFDASNSYSLASGSSLSSYLWDVGDGTITVGTAASAQITATFPAGYRWVSLTVTDSNAVTHTMYTLVVATDGDALSIETVTLAGDVKNGWGCTFRILETDTSSYPDGAAFIVWADESYGASDGSLNGYADREHVKFCGWLTSDKTLMETRLDTFLDDWDIVAEGMLGITDLLPAFSMTLVQNAFPATWFDVKGLDWQRITHHFMEWHSNITMLVDIEMLSVQYELVQYESDVGSLKQQISDLAEAVGTRLTCDHNNRLYFRRNPVEMSDAEIAATATIVALADTDWTERLDITRRHTDTVGAVSAYYLISSAVTISAVKTGWPGTAPGQGQQQQTLNRRIAQSQTEANQRTGRLAAWNNIKDKQLSISVLNGGLVADPAWSELLTFTTTAPNRRGLAYTAARFMLESVVVNYDHNTATSQEDWNLLRLLDSQPLSGITIQQPGDEPPTDNTEDYVPSDGTYLEQNPIPYENIVVPEYVPDTVNDPPLTVSDTMMAINNSKIYISSQLGQASPTWTLELDPGAGWAVYLMIHSQESDVSANDLRVSAAAYNSSTQQTRLYYNGDVLGVGTWDVQQTLSNAIPAGLRAVPGVSNAFVVRGKHPSTNAATLYYTDDNWATYSTTTTGVSVQGGGRLDCDDFNLGIFIVGVQTALYYTTSYTDAAATSLTGVSAISTTGFITDVRIPYRKILTQQLNNDANALQFIVNVSEAVSGATTWAITFDTSTGTIIAEVDITPIVGGTTYRATGTDGINTAGGNTQNILFCGHEESTSPATHDVLLSEDGGGSWTVLHSADSYEIGFFADGSTSIVVLWGGSKLALSLDKGTTLLSQYGDLPGTMGQNVMIFPT